MPFGKYKGLYLWEIDTGYLLWLLEQPRLREPLLSAVCQEVRARNDIETTSAPETDKDKVKRIYFILYRISCELIFSFLGNQKNAREIGKTHGS